MQKVDKKSLKSCLTKICGSKKRNDKNYECLPYQKEMPVVQKLPVLTPGPTKNKNPFPRRLAHLSKLTTSRNLLENPDFQSTKISQDSFCEDSTSTDKSMDHSSGISEESTSYAYSNSDYDSPLSSHSSTCSSEESVRFQYANQRSDIYVCQSSHNARFDGDIDLKYTERVYVLHATEEFTLVKKISGSQTCGYVSTGCLTSLDEFMKKYRLADF